MSAAASPHAREETSPSHAAVAGVLESDPLPDDAGTTHLLEPAAFDAELDAGAPVDPLLHAVLTGSRFTRLLPVSCLEHLERTAMKQAFRSQTVLLSEGMVPRQVCLVASGELTVRHGGYDGADEIIDHEGPGVMYGLGALTGLPSDVTWKAESEGALYAWDAAAWADDEALREHLQLSLSMHDRLGTLVASMRRSPLFKHTSPALLRRLVRSSSLVRYPRGSAIVREGETGDTVYHIVQGEVAIYRGAEHRDMPVGILRSGDTFGELALIGHIRRTATVETRQETEVLVITRPDFEILREDCASFRRLVSELARDRGITAEAPLPAELWWLVNRTTYPTRWLAESLAAEMGRQFGDRAVVAVVGDPSAESGVSIASIPLGQGPVVTRETVERLRHEKTDYVLCVCDRGDEPSFITAVRPLAPRILYFTHDASAPCDLGEGASGRVGFVEVRDPDWSWTPPRLQRRGAVRLTLPFRAHAVSRAERDFGPAFRTEWGRLARALTDRTIGLALGGGAAWGFAHFALLRALEREQIPVDVLSGTSMGALTGSFYASLGLEGLDILQAHALEIQVRAAACMVSSQAVVGLMRFLKHERLEELPMRFFPVAADIQTCTKRVFRQGDIKLAVRASCSLPGVFGPTSHQGRRYVDGCVMDNVPLQPLDEEGVDFMIASTAIPAPPPRRPMQASTIRRVLHQVSPLERVRDSVRSLFLLFHASGQYQVEDADVVFSARLAPFQPYDFRDADRIIATAEAQVQPAISAIQAGVDRLYRRQG